jgi:hypothetical protein
MDMLQMALMANRPAWGDEAGSALPNAPVVPHLERGTRLPRARTRAARALHRLGDVVSPSVPTGRAARRVSTCTGVRAH